MTRDRIVAAMAKALQDYDLVDRSRETVLTDDEAREQANIAFEAMVRTCMPVNAKRFNNGTWWGKTPTGDKMINRITVQL